MKNILNINSLNKTKIVKMYLYLRLKYNRFCRIINKIKESIKYYIKFHKNKLPKKIYKKIHQILCISTYYMKFYCNYYIKCNINKKKILNLNNIYIVFSI